MSSGAQDLADLYETLPIERQWTPLPSGRGSFVWPERAPRVLLVVEPQSDTHDSPWVHRCALPALCIDADEPLRTEQEAQDAALLALWEWADQPREQEVQK